MNLLLDTHVFLWWRTDSVRLPRNVRTVVSRAESVLVSAASGWEVAIKIALGRLRLREPFGWMVDDSGFTALPVTLVHTERLTLLPSHHRDPFDRMLIAQSQIEDLALVSDETLFDAYSVERVW